MFCGQTTGRGANQSGKAIESDGVGVGEHLLPVVYCLAWGLAWPGNRLSTLAVPGSRWLSPTGPHGPTLGNLWNPWACDRSL